MNNLDVWELHSSELASWQLDACDAWVAGDIGGPGRGTLEIFTGGGKTLIALECLHRAAKEEPALRAMIVVPTLALARQWRAVLLARTHLRQTDIGRVDGTGKDNLSQKRVLVAVLNSAAEYLPDLSRQFPGPLALVVDECHRAGAPVFAKVLETRARYRLGLSATAERDEVDDDGQPILYDDQVLASKLGRIVYRFDLREARSIGWLPDYTVHHHAVTLLQDERRRYEEISRRVDDLSDQLQDVGVERGAVRQASSRGGDVGALARSYVAAVSKRKDLLYRARERGRVTERILTDLTQRPPARKVLLFHERVDEAVALHAQLATALPGTAVGLEHSRLPEAARRDALAHFADGTAPTLVSVKSLVEGIDVPDADVGISVASSSSVRQRVQALGRVLRRRFDGQAKHAEMHILYVHDSVDEAIYGKEDWSDLTGPAANSYQLWLPDVEESQILPGPPRSPRPTEEQAWQSLGELVPDEPALWEADWPPSEWRLDSRGTISDLGGKPVNNPQGAAQAVRRIKPGGGRFRLSARHKLLIVPEHTSEGSRAWLVGKLGEPFRTDEPVATSTEPLRDVSPAHRSGLRGPRDRAGGSFQLSQKRGGLIQRKIKGGAEFAALDPGDGPEDRVSNAQAVLKAWRATGESGMGFHVNSTDEAYFLRDGAAEKLADVPGGFAWPGAQDTNPPGRDNTDDHVE